MYIANDRTSTPLIYGDFSTQKLTINNVLIIVPHSTAPISFVEGEVYYYVTDHKLKVFDGTVW